MQLLPYPIAFHSKNSSISFRGTELINLPKKELEDIRGKRISMIFQEPMTSLNPFLKVGMQIVESIQVHKKVLKKDAKEMAVDLLKKVEIPDPEQKFSSFPHQLSGGQRQRVMIAMALSNNPQILIADEPTTALDVTVEKELLILLNKLKEEENLSIIFITHDLNVVKRFADKVLVMNKGNIVERGTTLEIFSNPNDSYTKRLIESIPEPKVIKRISDSKILECRKLRVSYQVREASLLQKEERFDAVREVSFSLTDNSTLGIVGESGSGKSTILKAILGIEEYSGRIFFENKILKKDNLGDFRKKCQVVFQDPFSSLSPRMKVEEIIREGLDIHFKQMTKKLQLYKNVNLIPHSPSMTEVKTEKAFSFYDDIKAHIEKIMDVDIFVMSYLTSLGTEANYLSSCPLIANFIDEYGILQKRNTDEFPKNMLGENLKIANTYEELINSIEKSINLPNTIKSKQPYEYWDHDISLNKAVSNIMLSLKY